MSNTPPIPEASQSPFPRTEPAQPTPAVEAVTAKAADSVQGGVTAAQDAIGPLVEKAKAFARDRPYATAALVGTVALAVFNSLRGKTVK